MIDEIWDVIVCGGGTAGTTAAIAAAKQGAKTLVIESQGAFGGTQTSAWVTPMMPNYVGPFSLSRGLNLDIVREQTSLQPQGDMDHGDVWYDPAMLAIVLDRMASAAGVVPLFNCTLVDAHTDNGKVTTVDIVSRGGRQTVTGKTFIDCTGDAELSLFAGAELMAGNEDGVHQPLTLRFTLGGIDLEAARISLKPYLRVDTADYVELGYHEAKSSPMSEHVQCAIAKGVLQEEDLGYFQLFTVNGRTGELAFNAPRINDLDPLDPFQLSRAYQIGREKIARIARFMRETFKGFERSYISVIAPMIGIRESRRVVGEYVLTEDDHGSCRKFEDVIARNRYPVDIHLKVGTDYRKFPPGEWHDIPYRSIVVKGFENLWVAGRCASATFVAQSAIRIQPVCRAMGEAAGIAAAMCAQDGLAAMELPYGQLREKLDLSVPET